MIYCAEFAVHFKYGKAALIRRFNMYSLFLALIYISFISLGLPDSLLGSGWPVMHEAFGVPVSYMGIVTMVISGCTILSSLVSDKLTTKFSTRIVTVVSVFLSALSLLGFSFAASFWMLIVFSVPYGLGAGAIDAALNNYVALHCSSRHMSWLHCFWGVGTIVSPFVMSYAITASSWNSGYRIVSYIQFGIGVLLLLTLPVWNAGKSHGDLGEQKSIGIVNALKIKGVPFLLIGFFAYCSAEATAMSWSATYFSQVKGVDSESAAAYASLVFIGMTVGRFAAGFITDKLGDRKMILLGTAISACGVAMLFIPAATNIITIIGFVVIGLGYAPIYPCIIHCAPYNFGAENSGAIIGIQMASAYVGSTFMPPLYGLLGRYIGYNIMPIYLLVFMALMVYMVEKTFRLTAKRRTIQTENT